jgi:hypothetical protein
LTGGDEKLVHAVDYVKGNLVHDIIGMVQRILDDHLKVNPKVHLDLSKKLELLGNFLKNLETAGKRERVIFLAGKGAREAFH